MMGWGVNYIDFVRFGDMKVGWDLFVEIFIGN